MTVVEKLIGFFGMLMVCIIVANPALIAADTSQNKMDMSGSMMRMRMQSNGMVVNENTDQLPYGCGSIAGTKEITIKAGREIANEFPGTMFTYNQHEWHVEPCTKLSVTLENDDSVRHQWMIHGLPKSQYPMGMFTLSVTGPGKITGTFIVPPESRTYLVHCDVPTHMQKGMKGQLKVGNATRDIPSIPGITNPRYPDEYTNYWSWLSLLGIGGGFVIGLLLLGLFSRI